MSHSLQTYAAPHACNGLFSSADDPSSTINNVNIGAATNNNGVTTTTSGRGSIIERARIDEDNEKFFKSLPHGYRFCPTDLELIVHYLNKKIKNERLPRHRIHEVNIYRYSPENLSEIYPLIREKEWYFFTPRDRKYLNGSRPSRAADTGFWKTTGAESPIKNNSSTIGFKKTLVFHEGRPPRGKKTSWIMHEYTAKTQPRERTSAGDMRLDDYVLCRIYKKKSYKRQQKDEDEHQHGDINVHLPTDDPHSHWKMDDHVEEDYEDYPQVQPPPPTLPMRDYRDYPQVQPSRPPQQSFYGDCSQVQPSQPLQLSVYRDYSQVQPFRPPQLPVHRDNSQIQPSLPLQLPDYRDYSLVHPCQPPQLPLHRDNSQVQPSSPLQLPVYRDYSQVNLPHLPLRVEDYRDQPQVLPPPLPMQETFRTNVQLGADYHDGNWLDFKAAQNDRLPLVHDIFNNDFFNLEQVSWNTILENNPPNSSDCP